MPWNPLNQITLTDDWQFTDPVQGELFKIRHSNVGSVARAMICQATVINDELFLFQIREISANQNEIIKIEKQAFENRRLGFQQIYGELDWSIQIEEFMPEPSAVGSTVVRARRTTDQTPIISATRTTIVFNQKDFDPEACWDGTTYIVPVTGFYEFVMACRISAAGTLTGTSELQLNIKVDTLTYTFQRVIYGSASSVMVSSGSYYIYLTEGQNVQAQIQATFTGSTTIKVDGGSVPTTLLIRRY